MRTSPTWVLLLIALSIILATPKQGEPWQTAPFVPTVAAVWDQTVFECGGDEACIKKRFLSNLIEKSK